MKVVNYRPDARWPLFLDTRVWLRGPRLRRMVSVCHMIVRQQLVTPFSPVRRSHERTRAS